MKVQRWFRPVRITLALVFLMGFLVIFSDVKAKLPWNVHEIFTWFQFIPAILKTLSFGDVLAGGFIFVLILTIFSGRVYCSVLCPLGILQDILIRLRNLFPGKRIKRAKFRKALNFIRYTFLGLTVLSLFFTGILFLNLLDPYANFGRIAATVYQPVFIAVNNILSKLLTGVSIYAIQPLAGKEFHALPFFLATTVFLLLITMVAYRGRLFCNTVCPVGTFLGLVSRISIFKLQIREEGCTQCAKCQLVCKANCIDVKKMRIDESRCVSCFNCINTCEYSAVGYARKRSKPVLLPISTDNSKRTFFRSVLLYAGSMVPVLSLADNSRNDHHNEEEHDVHTGQKNTFRDRGPASPPGSISIAHLRNKCIGCQLCISNCPSKVLQPAFLEYGFTGMMLPVMVSSAGYCNYECTVCGEVCPTGAIMPLAVEQKKITQVAKVQFEKKHCVVEEKGTDCGSCSEHCPTQAVKMVPYKNDLTIPEIDQDICIGCGACEHACPVTDPYPAIYIVANKVHSVAQKPKEEKIESVETEEFPF